VRTAETPGPAGVRDHAGDTRRAEANISPRLLDTLAVALAAAAATSHLYTGALGLAVHRKRAPAAWPFGLVTACLAWATLCTGLANAVPPGEASPLLVLSTLLSGYGAPALWLFARQAVAPDRRPSPAWLLLGLPGSVFSVLALTDPVLLRFVVDFRAGVGPSWHPRLSPWYLGHAIELSLSLTLGGATIARGLRAARPGPYRDGLRWIGLSLLIGALTILTFTLLPGGLRVKSMLPWAPALTLPVVALSARGLRLLADPAASGLVSRVEAERRRRTAVEGAIRGVTTAVALSLARVDAKLLLLGAPSLPAGERAALLHRLRARVAEVRGLVDQLAGFAGAGQGPLAAVSIGALVDGAVRRAADRGLVVRLGPAPLDAPPALAPPEGLDHALDALIDNAAAAGDPAPRLSVWVERPAVLPPDASADGVDGQDAICVEVRDAGVGMGPELLAQAAEPFFTTRPGARGLGLSEVLAVARAAGGALHLASALGTGTVARLWLPLAAAAEAAAPGAYPLVALVEDDALAELLTRLAAARGRALLRLSGPRALADARAAGTLDGVRAALLPWRCGEVGAEALVAAVRAAAPSARVVLYGAADHRGALQAGLLPASTGVVVAPPTAGGAALCALLVAQAADGGHA
jgi:signal transduction histidine kinase